MATESNPRAEIGAVLEFLERYGWVSDRENITSTFTDSQGNEYKLKVEYNVKFGGK